MTSGFDGYLSKPISSHLLAQELDRLSPGKTAPNDYRDDTPPRANFLRFANDRLCAPAFVKLDSSPLLSPPHDIASHVDLAAPEIGS